MLGRRMFRSRHGGLRPTALRAGRWLVAHHSWLAGGALGFAIADGAFAPLERLEPCHFGALIALLGLLGLRVVVRFRTPEITASSDRGESARHEDLSLGVLLIATLHVLFQMTGGLSSPLYPLTYLFVAFATAFAEVWAGRLLIVACILAEGLALVGAGLDRAAWELAPAHVGFVLLFGLAWTGFLRAQILYQRLQYRQMLAQEQRRLDQEARDFRLSESPLTREEREEEDSRERAERSHLREGVSGIHRTVRMLLETLTEAYGLWTCALYWLDDKGRLCLREATSQSERFTERTLGKGEGLPGAVVSHGRVMRMHGLKPDHKGLPYYLAGEQVFAFCGIPVFLDQEVRGVLVLDRRHAMPFSEGNERVFSLAAGQVAQAIDNERIFVATETEKDAQNRFHRAVKSLNSAQDPKAVRLALLDAVREVASFSFSALARFDHETGTHTVTHVEGPERERLEGLSFASNQGIASSVVRRKTALPVTRRVDREPFVFTRDAGPGNVGSLLVLPLSFGGRVIATLTLAEKEPGAYPVEVRARLEVVASAAAVSLVNAESFQEIRRLATTDPLTGLFNRRVFFERFDETFARARRNERPMTLILADLDHFKQVNDTWGHPAGDEMLRRVAATLSSCVRETDVVARYGGEEFAILLEETDVGGGVMMAERIRRAVEELPVAVNGHTLGATLSAGCATWSGNGLDRDTLVDQADVALYRGKELGRNRVVHFHEVTPPPATGPGPVTGAKELRP